MPVFHRGVDLRIEAARLYDTAPGHEFERRDFATTERAVALFQRGTRFIRHAVDHGVAVSGGIPTVWPTTERAERRRWNRPAEDGAP